MRAELRFGISAGLAALLLASAPVLAQNTTAPAGNAADTETVGPRELENFSLNGTVTRPAAEPPARTTTPRPRAPTTAPAPTAARPPAAAVPEAGPSTRQPASPPGSAIAAERPATSATLESDFDFAGGTPASGVPSPTVDPGLTAPPAPPPASLAAEQSPSPLPWIIALLLGAGAAAYYFWRQRSRPELATAGAPESLARTRAEPARSPVPPAAPRPAAPPPAAAPRPQPAGPPPGVVSTRLRPWIEIQCSPKRCIVEADKATIEFDLILFNSGSAPAREVLAVGRMFNADEDGAIQGFFAHPDARGETEPVIAPLQRKAFSSAATIPLSKLRMFEAEGRRFFVPLMAFNALYRWSAGTGQTSVAYLVGRGTEGEKLAPFRVDLGPRVNRGLAARELELGIRK
jgi:hypothetical protein